MQQLQVIEIKGKRVLTTRQIAEAYTVKEVQISQNFKNNRERFVDGKHYISLSGDELKAFKNQFEKIEVVKNRTSHLYLWTEKGALLHAKSLNTDKAWEVYDYLVDFYFRAKEENKLPKPNTETRPVVQERNKQLVVNVPDNLKAQKIIREVKSCLGAMDALLDDVNRYTDEKTFKNTQNAIFELLMAMIARVTSFQRLVPKLIEKRI